MPQRLPRLPLIRVWSSRNNPRHSSLNLISATVIPNSDRDEESYCKDFSLPLEMTFRSDFQGLFELLFAKILPWRRHKSLFTKRSKFETLNLGEAY
jgi:hypothetical protein